MKAEAFPLSWEQLFWSCSPAFPLSLLRPATEYALTDFRLVVRRHGRTVQELALDEVGSVRVTQAWWQRPNSTSSVHVCSRRNGSLLELASIHHGPQIALILQLRAIELVHDEARGLGATFIRGALGPKAPSLLRAHQGLAWAATLAFALMFGVIAIARHDALPPVVYAADDPIAPNGRRRTQAEIEVFMEQQVMPFARRVIGPLMGGSGNVTCETCHGADALQRQWRMPGVRALPEPEFRFAGMERAGLSLDPQMRNAVYGYLAEADKQTIAGYMRRVVMPGMAALMHRPAYDFARSYGYNRSQAAVGCYHCHLVE
jgi:cytochrome c553